MRGDVSVIQSTRHRVVQALRPSLHSGRTPELREMGVDLRIASPLIDQLLQGATWAKPKAEGQEPENLKTYA